MTDQIINAEEIFNSLLPQKRLVEAAPKELIEAGREWSRLVWAEAEKLGAMVLSVDDIAKGLQLVQSPVFVCGVHRSGTTLVRDLLDGHPELVVLPSEGTYYTNLETKLLALPVKERAAFMAMEWLRRLANPINQEPYWLLGRSTKTASLYVDFAKYLIAWWDKTEPQTAVILAYASCTGKLGAKLWVDKTPTNERFLKRIWQEMPNAKIIHVVREPLATLASRKKMEPAITLRRALGDLKTSFQVAVEPGTLGDNRFLLVRYEELCDEPEVFKAQVASFLGVDNSDILNKPTVAGIPAKANSSFDNNALTGVILKPGSHQQSKILTAEEEAYISANIGDFVKQLGYDLPRVKLIAKLCLRLKYLLRK